MEPADWICPHCLRRHPAVVTSVVRCLDCRYVYPLIRPDGDETHWQADEDPGRTATDQRLPIRSDRYDVLRVLASGAQGKIYQARHRHLDQLCVIKVVVCQEDEWADVAVARLQAEARAGVKINHPNVARVLDCDCERGTWYFAMEFVEGASLRDVQHEIETFDWSQVVDIGAQTAAGLTAIHDAGLIHRDIKPGNVLIRADGQVKIMDLGLVKIRNAPKSMAVTRTGQVLGTPYYMPPEQFGGNGQLDSRADLYALGATMYHLVAGRPPFEGDGVLALVEKHRREPVTWSDRVCKTVPPWLRGVIERCLAKRPVDRFASAVALAQALQAGDDRSICMTLRAVRAAGPTPDQTLRPRGIVVAAWRNLSGRSADDWIGEALAEYLTSRLMELEGVHVADRQSLLKMLLRGDRPDEADQPVDAAELLDAARLVGAHLVIAGGFQCSGSALRITVHALSAVADGPTPLGSFSGTTADLFDLEDRIAAKVVAFVGHRLRPEQGRGGGTENVEAHEAYMRGRRSFADADYHRAIELSEQALALDPDYVEPLGLLGACFARLGEYDRAVEFHQRQEHRARETQDSPRLAEALGNLGVMYYYKGEYPLAFEFLDQARTLRAELKLTSDTAKYQGNLGFVLMRLERYDEAEAAFAEAIEISKENGDLVSLTWPYNGLGGVLLKQHRYPEAREYYRRALALADEIGDRVNVGISQMNLGRCAALLEDYAEAQTRFEAALTALQGTDFWNGLTLIYEHKAEMHLKQGDLDAALACVDQRLELARRHGNNRMEAQAWEQRARAFEQLRRTDQALEALRRSLEVSQRPAPSESLHHYLQEVAHRTAFR